MLDALVVILLVFLLAGGGWWGYGRYGTGSPVTVGPPDLLGVLVLVLIVCLVVWLIRHGGL